MLIGAGAARSGAGIITLRRPRITVVDLEPVPPRKKESTACQHSTAITGTLFYTVLCRTFFNKCPHELNRDFRTALFLRKFRD